MFIDLVTTTLEKRELLFQTTPSHDDEIVNTENICTFRISAKSFFFKPATNKPQNFNYNMHPI